MKARLTEGSRFRIETQEALTPPAGVLHGRLQLAGQVRSVVAREVGRETGPGGDLLAQTFQSLASGVSITQSVVRETLPTAGCMKLKVSLGQQRPVFPIHLAPSVLDGDTGRRRSFSYEAAVSRLADLLLAHRPPAGRTLIYACGQVDYFAIFSFQEVFRLLGVRNLAGNAEHCLNAGAVHNEMLTGQEGPFLTLEQGLEGPGRFYLLNGWNGFITHPPVFGQLLKRGDLDAYLVEVVVTESAKALAARLGPDRVLLVRSGSDPHMALAVAHEVLHSHPGGVDRRFLDHHADPALFERYEALAASEAFTPERVAERIAPESCLRDRLLRGIRDIACKVVRPGTVPIHLPSVGLSQTKGAVAHCLWGNLLGLVGKYGLRGHGQPAGGTLRVPGQINAETEVQGLSRRGFMGRIPVNEAGAVEAARRMGLPDDAYERVLRDTPRAALDYSEPTPAETPELFLCFGTQFESNMMGRPRWIRKLGSPSTTLVVIDPIPDPFSVRRAALLLPSPPHAAAAKLYQNGEWRLSLSVPRKRAPRETRTDATIVYDAMAEIARRLRENAACAAAHPDLARHARSGYLQRRFEPPECGGGLPRIDGEVSRPVLWDRILDYMAGGEGRAGPLYCRPEREDGRAVSWEDILRSGSLVYGGVGITRYRIDAEDPAQAPFRDIFRRPRKFAFFVPTESDLAIPEGIILNSGRSTLSDDKARVRFAIATFNSGKATSLVDMPEENPLYISFELAHRLGLAAGDLARVTQPQTGESLVLPVIPTDRVRGEACYISFHKCKAELEQGRYLNTLTSHIGRCPYTSQSNFKTTRVHIQPLSSGRGPAFAPNSPTETSP